MCHFRKGEISLIFEKPKVTSTCHYLNDHKKEKCHNHVQFCGSMASFHPGWLASMMMKCLHDSTKNPRVKQEFQWPLENGWAKAELTGNSGAQGITNDHQVEELLPSLPLLQFSFDIYLLLQLARLFQWCWCCTLLFWCLNGVGWKSWFRLKSIRSDAGIFTMMSFLRCMKMMTIFFSS